MGNRSFWKSNDMPPPLDDTRTVLRDIFGSDPPPAPDYSPVAAASEESARIGAEQADRVLAESTRQYNRNMEVAQPVIDTQLGIMRQTRDQGAEQYSRQRGTFHPVEDAMVTEALAAGGVQEQEAAAGNAVADVRRGKTGAVNAMLRQGMRYGMSKDKLSAGLDANATDMASAEAAAANSGRERVKSIGWAKKADVAGIGRNLTGASQGAYGLAINSGNSAVNNSMAPGGQLLNGTTAAAGLTMQGQGLRQQGLTSLAGMQTSNYNNAVANDSSGLGSILGMAKMGMDIYTGGKSAMLWGGK